jgi:hypothetical protein
LKDEARLQKAVQNRGTFGKCSGTWAKNKASIVINE